MATPTTSAATSVLEQFKWEPQPEAERLVHELVQEFLEKCAEAKALADRLRIETGTRFVDWVDHVVVPDSTQIRSRLALSGFTPGEIDDERPVFWNPHGVFPAILLKNGLDFIEAVIKVDSVVDFNVANGFQIGRNVDQFVPTLVRREFTPIRGLSAVERHGRPGFSIRPISTERAVRMQAHLEVLRTRARHFDADDLGFHWTEMLVDSAVSDLGRDLASDLFFAAEREYWQRRNHAAQVQKARQDRLGIGWANHDHHTYRSSRRHFSRLIAIWEKLGFVCRERFYAGKEAGWGAQVMEQPNAGIVTFNDVDLSPDELLIDFAHEPLPERKELGTVGLWCALHGESFLEAGMHHLECMFDFDALKEQLERDHGVGVMKPFTDLGYLKQAFTVGERWPVREERIAELLEKGQITPEQAQKFRTEGAIGSHLENLERNQGFKGFNQTGVSEIIAATDPRKHLRG